MESDYTKPKPAKKKAPLVVQVVTDNYSYRMRIEGKLKYYYFQLADRETYKKINKKAFETCGAKNSLREGWTYDRSKRIADQSKNGFRIPYCLDLIQEMPKEEKDIFWVEGEKDVDNLRHIVGVSATTSLGGSDNFDSTWKNRRFWEEYFKGKRVIVISDNDINGDIYRDEIVAKLSTLEGVTVVAPDIKLHPQEDISDWIERTSDSHKEKLYELINNAPLPKGFYSGKSLKEKLRETPHTPVIEGMLPVGVTMENAVLRTGKSTLALSFARAIVNGFDWSGMKTEKGSVIYIAKDGDNNDYEEKLELMSLIEHPDFHFLPPSEDGDNLWTKVLEVVRIANPKVKLIVWDTFLACEPELLQQGSKNFLVTQSIRIRKYKRLAFNNSLTNLLVHHESAKIGERSVLASGMFSQGLNNESNQIILITSDDKEKRFIETAPKSDANKLAKTELVLNEVTGEVQLGKTHYELEGENIETLITRTLQEVGATPQNEIPKLIKKNRAETLQIVNRMIRDFALVITQEKPKRIVEVPSSLTSVRTQNSTDTSTNTNNNPQGEIDDEQSVTFDELR